MFNFNERLTDIAQSLNTPKPIEINIFQEKAARHNLSEEMKRLNDSIVKFKKFAEPWFYGFYPEVSGLETSSNPLERQLHGIMTNMRTICRYFKEASDNLELIETKLIKRKRY